MFAIFERFELQMTKAQALSASKPGEDASEDVAELLKDKRITRQRVSGTANRQWRYVVGGKVDDRNTTWQDISTLPPVAARNGRTVRYRDAPARTTLPDAELARMAGRLTAMKNELATLRTQRMALESAIGNLGLQMNMAQ